MEMMLSNRTVGADEALEMGLVNQVVADAELDESAARLAATYAAGAPLAQAATKRLLWNTLQVERALPEEARTVSTLSATADSREGLAAVIGKRQPVFRRH
ncbi:enoyl-CoA hydratase/isomerase-like protein [Bordetella pertussis]|nr:enoyl-CoA hydratase/isomerase-like protein [Bordetella pertussis]CFP75553.1 enoyl-CoA hydratase/isomerase-like protein [Bordetella pertussis]CPI93252.1 enoyl-CoA hydratase/isomerase-like protein [Bordetella pertussis]CPP59624.1 enoyl-CoA hydratase/isomerase-like protein [Bordetella pertussis]